NWASPCRLGAWPLLPAGWCRPAAIDLSLFAQCLEQFALESAPGAESVPPRNLVQAVHSRAAGARPPDPVQVLARASAAGSQLRSHVSPCRLVRAGQSHRAILVPTP